MKKSVNEKFLSGVAQFGRKAAQKGDCLPSWLCLYQPETPEALKKLRKKK